MTDVPAAPDWRIIDRELWESGHKNVWASDSLGLTVVLPQGEVPPKPRPVKKKPPMPMGVPSHD